eukprot:scaffold186504_cov28-Tisochrysis_lutea.AAC.5
MASTKRALNQSGSRRHGWAAAAASNRPINAPLGSSVPPAVGGAQAPLVDASVASGAPRAGGWVGAVAGVANNPDETVGVISPIVALPVATASMLVVPIKLA